MRTKPLSPDCTPFIALDVIEGRFRRDLPKVDRVWWLRMQAIRAVAPLLGSLKNEDWSCLQSASQDASDRIWSHFLHDDRLGKMQWDPIEQRFVIRDRKP
jgi:hypothetical protein